MQFDKTAFMVFVSLLRSPGQSQCLFGPLLPMTRCRNGLRGPPGWPRVRLSRRLGAKSLREFFRSQEPGRVQQQAHRMPRCGSRACPDRPMGSSSTPCIQVYCLCQAALDFQHKHQHRIGLGVSTVQRQVARLPILLFRFVAHNRVGRSVRLLMAAAGTPHIQGRDRRLSPAARAVGLKCAQRKVDIVVWIVESQNEFHVP
jgi:hypothetical protein